MARSRVVFACLFSLALGCTDTSDLVLDLRTDLAPVDEFASVQIQLDGPSGPISRVVPAFELDAPEGEAERLTELNDLEHGTYALDVALLDPAGGEVVRRPVLVTLDTDRVVTILMTRTCAGVRCPDAGDPEATACVGGRCVSPECIVEEVAACGAADCAGDSDCATSSTCGVARCVAGACLEDPSDALCAPGQRCVLLTGCEGVMMGEDAGMPDAGGVDGGASDAGPPPPDAGPLDVPPPRRVAPIASQIATSLRPTFRWSLRMGSDGGVLYICADSSCSTIEARVEGTSEATAPADLTPGRHFYRLAGLLAGAEGFRETTTWPFHVRAGSPVDTWRGQRFDVNADGCSDLIVPAGAMMQVYLGSPSGLGPSPAFTLPSGFLIPIGDVDADGYSDVVRIEEGDSFAINVRAGGPTGFGPLELLTAVGERPRSIVPLGDLDGDGIGDFGFGAPDVRSVHLVEGSAMGLASLVDHVFTEPVSSIFGHEIHAADLDGDGQVELLISDPLEDGAAPSAAGLVHVYTGAFSPTRVETVNGRFDENLGRDLAIGDVNGDGLADLLATGRSTETSYTGSASYFQRGATAFGAQQVLEEGVISAVAGNATMGDFDGDGFADTGFLREEPDRLQVTRGTAAGASSAATWTIDGNELYVVEDFNCDGIDDLVISRGGVLDIYFGTTGSGLPGSPDLTLPP